MSLPDDADQVLREVQRDLNLFSTWMSGPRSAKLKQAADRVGALLDGTPASEVLSPAGPTGQSPETSSTPSNVAPPAQPAASTPAPDAPPVT